ncbi:hypothetical protein EYF80_029452 [Liparis tanakae]|uniref:Uncharacterized protein n=1 Tax=Liparis tanakae TaxID=230148 RepID=A0A4Z2H345_9TELE|nr:hypothetical protein EYF80_029452 [Liparis tanakae]
MFTALSDSPLQRGNEGWGLLYSSPQSPMSALRSLERCVTAVMSARSSTVNFKSGLQLRRLSLMCCPAPATPSRQPTMTPPTAGRSST